MAVSTGARTVNSCTSPCCFLICFQASTMSIRPAPCSYAWTPSIRVAVEVSAERSFAGVRSIPFCFALESSSAAAPVACGEAIEVPWSIE